MSDANATFRLDADASEAAQEIEDAFAAAIAGAFNSPEVAGAVQKMLKGIVTGFEKTSKAGQNMGKPLADAGKEADQLNKRLKQVVDSVEELTKKLGDTGKDDAFKAVGRDVQAVAERMQRLERITTQQVRAMEELGRGSRAQLTGQLRDLRRLSDERNQDTRRALADQQTQGANYRAQLKFRLEILRQFFRQAVLIEKAIGRAIAAAARIALAAFRQLGIGARAVFLGIGRVIARSFRAGNIAVRQFATLALATIRRMVTGITSLMRRVGLVMVRAFRVPLRAIGRMFRRQERENRASLRRQERDMKRFSRSAASSFGGVLRSVGLLTSALGVGFGVREVARTFIGGGIGRLTAIENSTVQLKRMGLEFEQINKLLNDVDETFMGTPFANPEGFDISAALFASGRSLEEIPTILGTIADFAAHGQVPLDQLADVFVRVASQGKVTGEELNRLTDANIPLTAIAEAGGITVEKLREMTSAGELTADKFFEMARAAGIFEGAAKAMGDTTTGALSNTQTAIKRLGEKFFGPLFGENGQAVRGLKAVQERIKGLADDFARAGEFVFGGRFDPEKGFIPLEQIDERLASIRERVFEVARGLRFFFVSGAVLFFLGKLGTGLRGIFRALGPFRLALLGIRALFAFLSEVSDTFATALANLGSKVSDLMSSLGTLITGGIGALVASMSGGSLSFTGFADAISGVIDRVASAVGWLKEMIDLLNIALGFGGGGGEAVPGTAQGASAFSLNNPFAGGSFQNLSGVSPAAAVFDSQNWDEYLVSVSELPEEAQRVFEEKFKDVKWVSREDAAQIWEQFTPEAEKQAGEAAEAATPSEEQIKEARKLLLDRLRSHPIAGPIVGWIEAVHARVAPVVAGVIGFVTRIAGALAGAFTFVSGIIGRLFDAIFGQDDQAAAFAAQGVGETGGGGNVFSRVLGFFTDTLLPGLQNVGGRIGDVVTKFIVPGIGAVIDFFQDVFIPGARRVWDSVFEFFRPAVEAVGDVLSSVWSVIRPIIDPLIQAIKNFKDSLSSLNIGALLRNAGIGAGAGLLVGGPFGAILGGLAGALTATPIFDGLIASIDNAWGAILGALESLWGRFTGWVSDQFSTDNLAGYGLSALGLVKALGEGVGAIATDPIFLAAIAAMGALAVTLIATFILGFATAALENLKQLAGIIKGLVEGAIGDVDIDLTDIPFVGDMIDDIATFISNNGPLYSVTLSLPIAAAIGGALGLLTTAPAVTTGATTAGTGIMAKLGAAFKNKQTQKFSLAAPIIGLAGFVFSSLTTALQGVFKGGINLTRLLMGDKVTGTGVGTRQQVGAGDAFTTRGKAIGASIAAGLALGYAGFASAEAGSVGGVIFSILGGAGVGAALGFQIGGPLGAGIGAALGAAAAAVGAFFGSSQAAAQKAREEIDEYVQALLGVDEALRGEAAGAVILKNLEDESREVNDLLIQAGFNAQDFAEKLIAGTITAEQQLGNVIVAMQRLGTEDISDSQLQKVNDLVADLATGAQELDDSLSARLFEDTELREGLAAIGIDFETLIHLADVFADEGGEIEDALIKIGQQDALADLSTDGEGASTSVQDLRDMIDQTAQSLVNLSSAGGILDPTVVSQILDPLEGVDRVAALEQAFKGVQDQIEMTRDALAQLIDDLIGGLDPEAAQRRFRLALPRVEDVAQRLFGGEEGGPVDIPVNLTVLQKDELDEAIAGVQIDLADNIAAGIRDGSIASQAEVQAALQDAISDTKLLVEEGELSPEVGEAIIAAIEELKPVLGEVDFSVLQAQLANSETFAVAARTAGGNIGQEMGAAAAKAWQAAMEMGVINATAASQARGVGFTGQQVLDADQPSDARGIRIKAEFDPSSIRDLMDDIAAISSDKRIAKAGKRVGEEIGSGISSASPTVSSDAKLVAVAAAQSANAQGGWMRAAGGTLGSSLASGVRGGAGSAASAGSSIGRIAALAAGQQSGWMYGAGAELARGLARGIRDGAHSAANAAAAIAHAAVASARRVIRAYSPSLVFRDIGRDVGRGFVLGIKDEEQSVANAMADAITSAIEKAVEKSAQAIERAGFAEKLFGLLIPSRLPGGASNLAVLLQQLQVRGDVAGFRGSLGASAAGAITGGTREHVGARAELIESIRTFRKNFLDAAASALGEAIDIAGRVEFRRSINTFAFTMRQNMGAAMNDTLGRLDLHKAAEQAAGNTLALREHTAAMAEQYREAVAARNAIIQWNRATAAQREQLGARPAPLSFEQGNILASGPASLAVSTVAGRANREAIGGALDNVRSWGEALLDTGHSARATTNAMIRYRDAVWRQARALGTSQVALRNLIVAYGLSNAQLRNWEQRMTSLNSRTKEGAANVTALTEQMGAIRAHGQELVSSGHTAQQAVAVMKGFRAQLTQQAVAFGFNRNQVIALHDAMGLSNADLARFISQLTSLNVNTKDGAANVAEMSGKLNEIRDFGAQIIEAGTAPAAAIAQMRAYRNQLVQQATQVGFNRAAVLKLVHSLGLSDQRLNEMQRSLTSLSQGLEQGRANIATLTGQLTDVRELGQAMLAAGTPIDSVIVQMKNYRNSIVQQARAFGFNAAEINKLVETVGLSDSALAEFVRQMREFDKAVREGQRPDVTSPIAPQDAGDRPVVENMNIYLPYGDPEAVGLGVANRLAYALPY